MAYTYEIVEFVPGERLVMRTADGPFPMETTYTWQPLRRDTRGWPCGIAAHPLYSKHLGLADKGEGVMLPWREHDDPQKEHVTVWTVFPTSTDYFDPSHAPFMVNYIVDDLDALLDRLKHEGVKIDAKRMNESYGRFAWIYDLDGNKIELWQPPSAKP
jgi:catechol 2,3-dioxygenase-like lactoylglutathione lyase family enzyme